MQINPVKSPYQLTKGLSMRSRIIVYSTSTKMCLLHQYMRDLAEERFRSIYKLRRGTLHLIDVQSSVNWPSYWWSHWKMVVVGYHVSV